MPQPGFEQPALSNQTLKLHIEWQIESLQALLQQVERRMADEAAAGEEAEPAAAEGEGPVMMGEGRILDQVMRQRGEEVRRMQLEREQD